MTFLPFGDSDHVVTSVSNEFSSNAKRNVLFTWPSYDYPVLIGTVSVTI